LGWLSDRKNACAGLERASKLNRTLGRTRGLSSHSERVGREGFLGLTLGLGSSPQWTIIHLRAALPAHHEAIPFRHRSRVGELPTDRQLLPAFRGMPSSTLSSSRSSSEAHWYDGEQSSELVRTHPNVCLPPLNPSNTSDVPPKPGTAPRSGIQVSWAHLEERGSRLQWIGRHLRAGSPAMPQGTIGKSSSANDPSMGGVPFDVLTMRTATHAGHLPYPTSQRLQAFSTS